MMVMVVAGVLGASAAPKAPLSSGVLFEVWDFTADFQIIEEEILKTKFNEQGN